MVTYTPYARWRNVAMVAGLVVLAATVADPSDATMLNPLGEEIRDLDAADLQMLKDTSHQLLEKNTVGALASWTNKETGHSGKAVLLRTFKQNGQRCGAVAHVLVAGGNAHFVLPFCESEPGTWKIVF